MFKLIPLLVLLACSTGQNLNQSKTTVDREALKDFSPRELITTTQMLTKIYDGDMKHLSCVPDQAEAELLLRTLRPRMEVVIDDIEALFDQDQEINSLANNCSTDCTCEFIDELFREHQITLTKAQKKNINLGIAENKKSCLSQRAKTFCSSALKKELDKEKSDFSFE